MKLRGPNKKKRSNNNNKQITRIVRNMNKINIYLSQHKNKTTKIEKVSRGLY